MEVEQAEGIKLYYASKIKELEFRIREKTADV
jgi:hypothetical protein